MLINLVAADPDAVGRLSVLWLSTPSQFVDLPGA